MDKKSILIGALGASLLFVTLGATVNSEENEVGTFQAYATAESTHMINTKTGEVFSFSFGVIKPIKGVWQKRSKDEIFKD